MTQRNVDPITFAVVKNALDTIVDDMAFAVMRTARSPIIRDVLDYSVTMCDAKGRILAQAKTVALHLGAVPDAVDVIIDKYAATVEPGDVIILNDPYEGGMHLPDIFMFKPIFHEKRLQGFSVVIAHHCDVGGRVPGSNAADSTEIFQEGIRIPPTKLYQRGEPNETLINIIRKNVRLPDLVLGDLDAQLATCNIGERELLRMIDRYGEENLQGYFDELLDYGERLTRQAIEAWPDGVYRFTDYIDNDGFSEDAIPIQCAITVAGSKVSVDFAGSSPQVRGAINSTLSFVKSATYLSVRCALEADVPNNAGVYRCIEITAPEGSILNPRMPAPVAARALTGYRVVDCVLGALAQIAPKKVMAAGEGGNTVIALSGYAKGASEPFILVDMINGAWGGRFNKDGVEGVTNPRRTCRTCRSKRSKRAIRSSWKRTASRRIRAARVNIAAASGWCANTASKRKKWWPRFVRTARTTRRTVSSAAAREPVPRTICARRKGSRRCRASSRERFIAARSSVTNRRAAAVTAIR